MVRIPTLATMVLSTQLLTAAGLGAEPRLTDDTEITRSTRVPPGTYKIVDKAEDGAIHVRGDNLTIDFQGATLDGSRPGEMPDAFTGTGIVLSGRKITLRNVKIRGYKVGIHAIECPGLIVEDADLSGNYQKRLLSTPAAEDGSDWLWPHNNDNHEWTKNYGAALCVEQTEDATIRRIRVRHGQNGIVIDRVSKSKIYDNDCSFLSGWGLAMWRSNDNVITRNAFDFCVRGYSHGVYNRGQDSAGILMFEQNNRNVIAENSVTHGGDGFFGFAGLEALGDKAPPAGFNHKRKGNNENLLIRNDFSYAPAHGIEMTFSFGNKFLENRLVGNAICGVWGGYCQETLIAGNTIENNGEMGYGLERGGINIDSGRANRILDNTFRGNKCGVHLWGPPSPDFMKKPWGSANAPASADNVIAGNTFDGDRLALHLRGTNTGTVFADNTLTNVEKEVDVSAGTTLEEKAGERARWEMPKYPVYGDTRPVGARKQLAGRDKIIVTEWGPYDYTEALVFPGRAFAGKEAVFQVLGPEGTFRVTDVQGEVEVSPREGPLPSKLTVTGKKPGLTSFKVRLDAGGKQLQAEGVLLEAEWKVSFFRWATEDDPREHEDRWKKLISGKPVETKTLPTIDFKWGGGGPSREVGNDHFGTVATTAIELPAGKYRVWTVSDDGIRVWVDDKKVIDDWTWHAPKENTAEVQLEGGKHRLRVEHFEIDGFSQLQVRIEPLP